MKLRTKISLIFFFLIAAGAAGAFFIFGGGEKVEYVTANVERGDLEQTVSEVGTVKAVHEVVLSFLRAGKLGKVLVEVGDLVEKDQILAELDYSSLLIQEQEASASLDIANANLNKVLRGATRSEIAVKEASVEQAKVAHTTALDEYQKARDTVQENVAQATKKLFDLESDLSNNVTPYEQAVITAQVNLNNTKSTYLKSIENYEDTALITADEKLSIANTALDNIKTILDDKDAKDFLSVRNSSYLTKTNSGYDESLALMAEAEEALASAETSMTQEDINLMIDETLDCLAKVFETLNYCYNALESSIISTNFTQTELDTYKTTVSTKISSLSTGVSAIQTARQNLSDAVLTYSTKVATAEDSLVDTQVDLDDAILSSKNSLSSTKFSGEQTLAIAKTKSDTTLEAWDLTVAQLEDLKSPARSEDVVLYRAQVKQAEASLNLIKKQIEDSILKSPIDGRVIEADFEIGEQVALNTNVVTLLGDNDFEIEVDISEADIAKVRVGNATEVTFDAFGDDLKASGRVNFIEPAETIIQDVIYYRVKVSFDAKEFTEILRQEGVSEVDIKPGMTANIVVTTASKNNVLIIPSRAILDKNGQGKFTRILKKGEVTEIPVEIGLRGDGGMVEILSGTKEGEEVVTYIKK